MIRTSGRQTRVIPKRPVGRLNKGKRTMRRQIGSTTENFTVAHPRLAEARVWMSGVCGNHSWLKVESESRFRLVHTGRRLSRLATTVGFLECGTDVVVGFHGDVPMSSYNISLPVTGQQELNHTGSRYRSDSDTAIVVTPGVNQELAMSGNCRRLHVAIQRTALRNTLEEILNRPAVDELVFKPTMDASRGEQGEWWRLVRLVAAEAQSDTPSLFSNALVAADIEKAMIKSLLICQPSNYSEEIEESLGTAAPEYITRARNFIHRHARESIAVEDIAHAVGIGRDKLFEGFREHYGITPFAYLKKYRLERVHEALTSDRSRNNISAIASDWGFPHLGRFSMEYRELFGETPSQTVKRYARKTG